MKNNVNQKKILLSHGGGGKHTRDLINEYFLPGFENPALQPLGDAALINAGGVTLAFTTDTYVVKPMFFPGGDIGDLAINGTVNDLAVSFAKPLAVSAGFIIEEGTSLDILGRIIDSMKTAADKAGVNIVTGDTKVVEKGGADGVFINTSGVGVVQSELKCPDLIEEGDRIIVNGPVGDHGLAVLSAREGLPVESDIRSDSAPLNTLITPLLSMFPQQIKFMRDATRGGLITVLNEVVDGRGYGVDIHEDKIPVNEAVRAVSEMLGLDPLYIANEGKVTLIAKKDSARDVLDFIKKQPLGQGASVIGEITRRNPGRVVLCTVIGGGRIMDMLIGDQLPRIC